ncbi:hypothetical protein D3C86_1599270 [compost metagenome]
MKSDYGDRHSTRDAAEEFRRNKMLSCKYVNWDLAYLEIITDDPNRSYQVVYFMTELGERFYHSFDSGVFYNFELDKPDPAMTFRLMEPYLEHTSISPEALEWLESITSPDTIDLKRRLVFKKLEGYMNNGWLIMD